MPRFRRLRKKEWSAAQGRSPVPPEKVIRNDKDLDRLTETAEKVLKEWRKQNQARESHMSARTRSIAHQY
jgi:ElaB/YqjD/DUF883 family membrane-anchored ribosome-binding protein